MKNGSISVFWITIFNMTIIISLSILAITILGTILWFVFKTLKQGNNALLEMKNKE